MKIVKIKAEKKKVLLQVDNNEYLIEPEIVYTMRLHKDSEITEDELNDIIYNSQCIEAYNKMLVLLSKSTKTVRQVKDYMYGKQYRTDVINATIEKLIKADFLNDNEYARRYIEENKDRKGRLAIKNALMTKGIKSNIIEEEMKDFETSGDIIRAIAEKFLKGKPNDIKTRQKLYRHLLSKGFTYDEIKKYGTGDFEDGSWD